MPVLKADAYGHGLIDMAKILRSLGIKHIGVATLGEAILLRKSGDKGRILGWLYDIDNPEVVDTNRYYDLKDLIKFVTSDNPNTKIQTEMGRLDYIPTTRLRIPVDKETVLKNGTVSPDQAGQIVDAIEWRLNKQEFPRIT